MKHKIITIVGARPQFVKAAAFSLALKNSDKFTEKIIHTGQHFDENMSDIFFKQMNIPKPDYHLNINSLTHGAMTAGMLEEIEKILIKEAPDFVLVFGDTNSTLAGALAAKKLNIKLIHVEAGLRSFNMKMPEEINRILTDRISDYLFCPTETAINNLKTEGYENFNCKFLNVGDIMFDAAVFFREHARPPKIDIPKEFIISTIHRAENVNDDDKLKSLINALNKISEEVTIIFPIHPGTRKKLQNKNIKFSPNIKITAPLGYLEILDLLKNCKLVMTDSGGMQKEAYFFKKHCITLREETEWTELTECGCNILTGSNEEKIIRAYNYFSDRKFDFNTNFYGDANTAQKIITTLEQDL